MLDSIIQKANEAVALANAGKCVVATGDILALRFLEIEICLLDRAVICFYSKRSKNRLLIKKL